MTSVFEKHALVQAGDGEQAMKALCLAALFRADTSVKEPQVCRHHGAGALGGGGIMG